VEGHCTCGTRLAEDARFCHRCGRPVRDDDPILLVAEPEPEFVETPLAAESAGGAELPGESAPLIEVSFRSPLAVRVGFLAAAIVQLALMLITMVHMVPLLPVIVAGGGAYAVLLFCRRGGRVLSITEGARMGWIAGVFGFVISTVLFTAGLVVSGKGVVPLFEENLKTAGLDSASTTKAMEMIRDPQVLGLFLVLMLVFNFLLISVVSSLGGALGARLTRRG
jgi:hypothetical protein